MLKFAQGLFRIIWDAVDFCFYNLCIVVYICWNIQDDHYSVDDLGLQMYIEEFGLWLSFMCMFSYLVLKPEWSWLLKMRLVITIPFVIYEYFEEHFKLLGVNSLNLAHNKHSKWGG